MKCAPLITNTPLYDAIWVYIYVYVSVPALYLKYEKMLRRENFLEEKVWRRKCPRLSLLYQFLCSLFKKKENIAIKNAHLTAFCVPYFCASHFFLFSVRPFFHHSLQGRRKVSDVLHCAARHVEMWNELV